MATWQSMELAKDGVRLSITSAPGEHAPGWAKSLLPPVMGSILELSTESSMLRIYVTGDTLYRPWLREVVDRYGPLDAAVVHLGGTRVLGVLVSMNSQQGASLVDLLRPSVTVPVHYDDYTVFRSPCPTSNTNDGNAYLRAN